jgi:hypothetical protein
MYIWVITCAPLTGAHNRCLCVYISSEERVGQVTGEMNLIDKYIT